MMELLKISIDFANAVFRNLEKAVLKPILNYVVDRLTSLGVYTALPDICADGLRDYCYILEDSAPPFDRTRNEGYD